MTIHNDDLSGTAERAVPRGHDAADAVEHAHLSPEVLSAQEEFLAEITKDFHRLQKQKARLTGGVEARILTNCAFIWGEQFISQQNTGLVVEKQDAQKLYLVFNLIEGAFSKLIGRLSSIAGIYRARPNKKDAKALGHAEVVDKVLAGLDEKLDEPSKTWTRLWWMGAGGVVFEYVTWVPNATIEPVAQFDEAGQPRFTDTRTQQPISLADRDAAIAEGAPPEQFEVLEDIELVGDVGSEILSPLNVFLDQSVTSIENLAPDQRVHIAKIRTAGWIKENFGVDIEEGRSKKLEIVTTQFFQDGASTASLFLKDMLPLVQGQQEEDDPAMAVVVEAYQPSSQTLPHGRYTIYIPDKTILFDGPNPYEEIPLVDFHWQPVTTTFWTKDYVTDLIAPQRFLNKRLSQLGEQANATIYDKILLGGTLTPKDIPADFPGMVLHAISETGAPLVARLPGPQLPGWFLESVNVVLGLQKQISGGSDLFQEQRFPGQLRGPLAVPMLQEILDTEWGPLYQHIGSRTARVKQMRLNRVKQFYPPIRTMHYTNRDQRDEVLEFHADKILRAGTSYNVTVERSSLLPELRALNEARIKERLQSPLSILYTDERTGRLDKSKIAQDLKMSDVEREDRESQGRTFIRQLITRLWRGEQLPPVMPFWPHEAMMDELEAEMTTTEFLSASMPIQTIFFDRWQQHMQFLQQRADAQAKARDSDAIQNAVAQATQQAAAQAAAETVKSVMSQVGEQAQMAPNTKEFLERTLAARNET